MSENSFDARATLSVGGRDHEIFRLDALQQRFDVARLPFSLKILLENLLRNEDGVNVRAQDIESLSSWDAKAEPSIEIVVRARPRADAGLHRCAGGRRPRGDARRDRRDGRRPGADQPAGTGRARDRPLRPGRRVRLARRVRAQRRARVRAQPRALRVPALGPGRRSRTSRSCRPTPASSTRSTSSTSRASSSPARKPPLRSPAAGLPRHARRHRLAHDDGQRPRRARLGRRRDRGRGGDARPADVDADPAGASASSCTASCARARPRPTSC